MKAVGGKSYISGACYLISFEIINVMTPTLRGTKRSLHQSGLVRVR
jgi:hypothetical protein